jgi:2-deoxy-scyllo-inosamine dehydrogenase (SAM-dependent)
LAALLASLDIIISFDNDAAHLAAALGKPVWLLTPYSEKAIKLDSWASFSNVTIFGQPSSGSWKEVIQAIALFRFLQPESSSFIPFSTDHTMFNQSATLPFPTIHFENTSQLTQILDAELATFTSVSIETTTVCNLKCSYCPNSTDAAKPPTFMPDEMFFRIIDSLHEYAPLYHGSIAPSMYGEPLLDKRIETFIRYAKNKFPLATIELFTNGDFLTPERFFSLRDAGVGHFNISQHTPARSQALSDTLAIVQREFGGEVPITINKMLEQNKFNRGGLVDVEGYSPEICARMSHCIAAYQNLSFDNKGDALLCCNDYQAKHTFGNIASKSIRDIWNGSNYRQIRNMSMLGFLPFPICRVCLNH